MGINFSLSLSLYRNNPKLWVSGFMMQSVQQDVLDDLTGDLERCLIKSGKNQLRINTADSEICTIAVPQSIRVVTLKWSGLGIQIIPRYLGEDLMNCFSFRGGLERAQEALGFRFMLLHYSNAGAMIFMARFLEKRMMHGFFF